MNTEKGSAEMNRSRRKKQMDNIEVIGVDHGWSQMKTVHTIFSAGIEEILSEPAFFDDVLEYENRYSEPNGMQ